MDKRATIEERFGSGNEMPLRFSVVALRGSFCKLLGVDAELSG